MAKTPSLTAATQPAMVMAQVSGNPLPNIEQFASSLATSVALKIPGQKTNTSTDRGGEIAKQWQRDAYRFVNTIGIARYAVTLFSNMAGRAEIGVSEPQALAAKAQFITSGPEVDAFAEVAPTVRERSKMIRDYMNHRTIAGECYLIARSRQDADPGYEAPPDGFTKWEDYARSLPPVDAFAGEEAKDPNPNEPIWEIVGVTELRKTGTGEQEIWEVRYDNTTYIPLSKTDPVIRMWSPDPENRREAWSPFRSLNSCLHEIEWATMSIITQLRSRMMAAGVWFLPNNMTFPPPPPDSVNGGEQAIASMNEAQRLMASIAVIGSQQLESDEVAIPTIVTVDPAALEQIDQGKLIQFWSEVDDKVVALRADSYREFAMGMDLPPEMVLGSSGVAISGSGGSAGSVNHWGEWAKEEQTISAHIEPALDDFVGVLTVAILRVAIPNTLLVIAYDTASLRLRQDRSKESILLYDRGLIKGKVVVKENGFDPELDMMDEKEFKQWILTKMVGGAVTPEQIQAAMVVLGIPLPNVAPPSDDQNGQADVNARPAPKHPGSNEPTNTDGIEQHGPPQGDHEHNDAPYAALLASSEVLVLRALEKAGNRLLNSGKRGKDRDRSTPPIKAHLDTDRDHTYIGAEFDFSLGDLVFADLPTAERLRIEDKISRYCADLYNTASPYSREALIEALRG